MAEYLIRHGAPASGDAARLLASACPTRTAPAAVDEELHEAAARGGAGMKELIDAGLSVAGRDARGRTPLHLAAEFVPDVNGLVFLLDHGAAVDAPDGEGRTPLHAAAAKSSLKAAARLLDAGANPNAADDRGRSPLHLIRLVNVDSFQLYRLLLAKGARATARDVMGRTPLHAVYDSCDDLQTDRRDIARILVCAGADPAATDRFGWTASDIARVRGWAAPSLPTCSPPRAL